MISGVIFDISELSIHDGPGLRITVFLKGCPMRCVWCHNPEGLEEGVREVHFNSLFRRIGKEYEANELAETLNGYSNLVNTLGGGITFSGGEPLNQARFLSDVIDRLHIENLIIETSGFCDTTRFLEVIRKVTTVYFDLKIMDEVQHIFYTGKPNKSIMRNLRAMSDIGVEFVVRVPLIPGITDTSSNLCSIAEYVRGLRGLKYVEFLPFNKYAGAKYHALGLKYLYKEVPGERIDFRRFEQLGIPFLVVD